MAEIVSITPTGMLVKDGLFGTNVVYQTNTDDFALTKEANDIVSTLRTGHIRFPAGKGDVKPEIAEDLWLNILRPNFDNSGDRILNPELTNFLSWANAQKARGNPIEVTLVLPTKIYRGVEDFDDYQADLKWTLKTIAEDFPLLVSAYEIGNEYWGAMDEHEYARIANAALEAISELKGDLEKHGQGPNILVQMASPNMESAFSPTLEGVIDANRAIIENISSSNLKTIDGLIEHYYFNLPAGSDASDSRRFNRIDVDLDVWRNALGEKVKLYITEWNNQTSNESEWGIRSGGVLVEMIDRMARSGVDVAHLWAMIHNTTTSFATLSEEIRFDESGSFVLNSITGAVFSLLGREIADSEVVDLDVKGSSGTDFYGFRNARETDLVVVSQSSAVETVILDLNDQFLHLSEATVRIVQIDQETSDGMHRNPNAGEVTKADSIILGSHEYFFNEHDVGAKIRVETFKAGQDIELQLSPYEVAVISFSADLKTHRVPTVLEFNRGTNSSEFLNATAGDDIVSALRGDDTIATGAGNDILWGYKGDDLLIAGADDDVLRGGSGNDTMRGGDGNDTIVSSGGHDRIIAGPGRDVINVDVSSEQRAVIVWDYNPRWDTVRFTSQDGTISSLGDLNHTEGQGERVYSYEGFTLTLKTNRWEKGEIVFDYSIADLSSAKADGGGMFVGVIGDVKGGKYNDYIASGLGGSKISGNRGDDTIVSGRESDMINGGHGNDFIEGGSGRDSLRGGAGDDTIISTDGRDQLVGGEGNDVFVIFAGSDARTVRIWDYNPAEDHLIISSTDNNFVEESDKVISGAGKQTSVVVENLTIEIGASKPLYVGAIDVVPYVWTYQNRETAPAIPKNRNLETTEGADEIFLIDEGSDIPVVGDGRAGDDNLWAAGGDDDIAGGLGDDTIVGAGGDDVLLGNDGDDLILGGDGKDTLLGGSGSDHLIGGRGIDILWSGDGLDRLEGDEGNDILVANGHDAILVGGDGADIFIIEQQDEFVYTTILDYDAEEDVIVINSGDEGTLPSLGELFAIKANGGFSVQVGSYVNLDIRTDASSLGYFAIIDRDLAVTDLSIGDFWELSKYFDTDAGTISEDRYFF